MKVLEAKRNWRGVIKWEGRLDALLKEASDDECRNDILIMFTEAHKKGMWATCSADHALSIVRLQVRRIELLGNNQRFRDQGEAMCDCAEHLLFAGQGQEATRDGEGVVLFFHVVTTTRGAWRQEAERYFQQARDVGAAHGFFSVECKAPLNP